MIRPAWLLLVFVGAAHAAVPEPGGYRLDHYRAPVPETLHGAQVVHTASLQAMIHDRQPLLIDVLPDPTPPVDARANLPRMPIAHSDIPGSLWLADTGRGALSVPAEAWFRASLHEATQGDRARPMVFYCLSQCWMSWNAAKRAVSYGYSRVMWYPDGADGWQSSGLTLSVASPVRH